MDGVALQTARNVTFTVACDLISCHVNPFSFTLILIFSLVSQYRQWLVIPRQSRVKNLPLESICILCSLIFEISGSLIVNICCNFEKKTSRLDLSVTNFGNRNPDFKGATAQAKHPIVSVCEFGPSPVALDAHMASPEWHRSPNHGAGRRTQPWTKPLKIR